MMDNVNTNIDLLKVATINVNGIRAAYRNNMENWLKGQDLDILCLQETRAPYDTVQKLLGDSWHIISDESVIKGRAGVAIASKVAPNSHRVGIGLSGDSHTGRWVEGTYTTSQGNLVNIASVYVHSGEVDTPKQVAKYEFLDAMQIRMSEFLEQAPYSIVAGDINIAHTRLDIKNWKANRNRAGFLMEESAQLDKLFTKTGWVDVTRKFVGDIEGPYTWWSWRGQSFTNDVGWRIDYQIVLPQLADLVQDVRVAKAETYEARFSDHAPLIASYKI